MVLRNLDHICKEFITTSRSYFYKPFGSGHINNTFLVTLSGDTGPNTFVLQQINRNVFPRPHEVMHNIVMVTRIIKEKANTLPDVPEGYVPLEVIPSRDGNWFFEDKEGQVWRMYNYIPESTSVDELSSPSQAWEIGGMFGFFQKCLVNLDPANLFMTIPHFHDASYRLRHFEKILYENPCKRNDSAGKEIGFLLEHQTIFQLFEKKLQGNNVPARITHNDTKVNNVLLHRQTGKGLCVIDLDTVMPGYSLYDFGDLVRSGSCPAAEDETDLQLVRVEPELFQKLAEGYLSQSKDFLTETEVNLFPLAGMYITLIMAMRFLTDYLEGDVYYKIHHPGHNLDRCRTQMKLVTSLLEHQKELEERVMKLYSGGTF